MPVLMCPRKKTLNEDLFYKGSSANHPRLHTCKNKVPFWDFQEFAVTIRTHLPVIKVAFLLRSLKRLNILNSSCGIFYCCCIFNRSFIDNIRLFCFFSVKKYPFNSYDSFKKIFSDCIHIKIPYNIFHYLWNSGILISFMI